MVSNAGHNILLDVDQKLHFTRPFSNESTEPNERNDVASIRRTRRQRYTLDDVFGFFDPFDRYFKSAMVCCGLVFLSPFLENQYLEFNGDLRRLKGRPSPFKFQDCNSIGYDEFGPDADSTLVGARNASSIIKDDVLSIIGDLVGPIFALFMRKWSPHDILLFTNVVSFGLKLLWIFGYTSFYRLSYFLAASTYTIIYITTLRYFVACVPKRLMPFGWFFVNSVSRIVDLVLTIFVSPLRTRNQGFVYVAPAMDVFCAFVFYIFAPPPILETLVGQNAREFRTTIKRYSGCRKLDPDAMIDDLLFKEGRTTLVSWYSGVKLYMIPHFLCKSLTLIYLSALSYEIEVAVVERTIRKILLHDLQSGMMVLSIMAYFTYLLVVVLLYRFGTRRMIYMSVASGLIGMLITYLIPKKRGVNFAHMDETHAGGVAQFAFAASLLTDFCCRMMTTISDLGAICTFPVESNALLLCLHFMARNVLLLSMQYFGRYIAEKNQETGLETISVFAMLCLAGILSALFLDDTHITILTTGDVPKFCETVLSYDKNPLMDDDTILIASPTGRTFFRFFRWKEKLSDSSVNIPSDVPVENVKGSGETIFSAETGSMEKASAETVEKVGSAEKDEPRDSPLAGSAETLNDALPPTDRKNLNSRADMLKIDNTEQMDDETQQSSRQINSTLPSVDGEEPA